MAGCVGRNELLHDIFNPAHLAVGQTYFDTMGVTGAVGQDFLNHAAGETTAALVLFKNNFDLKAGLNVGAGITIHWGRLYSGGSLHRIYDL